MPELPPSWRCFHWATSSKFVLLYGAKSRDNQTTTWTLTIQSTLKNWTSGTYTRSISCPATGERDGFL